MDVTLTLKSTHDSYNTYNRDPVMIQTACDIVRITLGDRHIDVNKAEFLSAAKVIGMTEVSE